MKRIRKGLLTVAMVCAAAGCATVSDTSPSAEGALTSEHIQISTDERLHGKFFDYVRSSETYPLFQRILEKLSADIEVEISSHRMETYSSFSGFSGYAEAAGSMRVYLDTVEEEKEFHLRVDGEEQSKNDLKTALSRSLAHKLIAELKAGFVYMTSYYEGAAGETAAKTGGAGAREDYEGPVFTVSSEEKDSETEAFKSRLMAAVQQVGYPVVQPEYFDRLMEINRYKLSGMTEETGEIMEFFNIEFLLSVKRDGGFFAIDVVDVYSAEVLHTFSVSGASSRRQLVSIIEAEIGS
jgi:hypothetical protein